MRGTALVAAMAAIGAATSAQAESGPSAADVAALRAELDALRAKVDDLEKKLAETQTAAARPAPATPAAAPSTVAVSFRGAPVFEDKAAGFTFKPKGFLQFDSGRVYNPSDALNATGNFGNRTRMRRAVLGFEGKLPAGFGYNAEFNFADGQVGYEDVILTWDVPKTPVRLTIGNMFPLSGLDSMTSSRLSSMVERAEATEAFNLGRRVGASIGWNDPKDQYSLTAGLYQTGITSDFGDDGWQASARATFSPQIGENARLHLGVNYQHRSNRTDIPQTRYRTRPVTNITDFRFADTSFITAKGDDVVGLELAGIFGPVHIVGEGYKLWVHDFTATRDQGGLFYSKGPSFTSGYAEIGWYLTGETRGYKGAKWDRVKVLKPIGKGGWGAFQLNARVDMVDLTDRVDNVVVNGGKQTAYSLSAIWNPIDYIRFLAQYSHLEIEGGPQAFLVVPNSVKPLSERMYDTDVMVLRAQVDF